MYWNDYIQTVDIQTTNYHSWHLGETCSNATLVLFLWSVFGPWSSDSFIYLFIFFLCSTRMSCPVMPRYMTFNKWLHNYRRTREVCQVTFLHLWPDLNIRQKIIITSDTSTSGADWQLDPDGGSISLPFHWEISKQKGTFQEAVTLSQITASEMKN